jgi:hypothetical protein
VQVRAGGPPGGAHATDVLALADALALLDGHGAQVGVNGDVPSAMIDENDIAVAILAACEVDLSVSHGHHGRSGRCCIVDPLVGRHAVEDRIEAHGKPTGQPAVFERHDVATGECLAV